MSNTGNVNLPEVTLKDYLPSFLTYNGDATGSPVVEEDHYIEWNFGTLNVGCYVEVEFSAHVDDEGDDYNIANVTSCAGVTDEDNLRIIAIPHFEVDKKVWNGSAWADELDHVHKGEKVRFQITTTYYGDGMIDCGIIADYLPNLCLEYVETVSVKLHGVEIDPESTNYPYIVPDSGDTFIVCDEEINISEELERCSCIQGEIILWDFREATGFDLIDGQSVVIEFDALVTEYCDDCDECCEQECCIVNNVACALMWGCYICSECNYYFDCDCTSIRCCPPPTTFTKKVLVCDEWVDEIETVTGSTITFKLELEYYGNENLTEIQLVDELPCILEYVEGSAWISVVEGDIGYATTIDPYIYTSGDVKILVFNITGELEDGGIITIEFDAFVEDPSPTGCCGGCPEGCINYAYVQGKIGCVSSPNFFMDAEVGVMAYSNCAPSIPQLAGDSSGEEGESMSYTVWTTDEDDDQVYYMFDWDDGTELVWDGPYNQGESEKITLTHSWSESGSYEVKVRAKDEHGLTSGWTNELDVEITGEEPDIEITIAKWGFGNLGATIKNNAEDDFSDVEWNMSVAGGFLGGIDSTGDDVIETLESGDEEFISTDSGSISRSLGFVDVEVLVTVDEDTFEKEETGFVFGKFIIIL
ncbi:MAG: hypothetical protein JSW62_00310 [Thermoplasmatales archaeon]|nr:MAG: hypothetical protein JSW62_00310 [Thermoplasmatales archaeon]